MPTIIDSFLYNVSFLLIILYLDLINFSKFNLIFATAFNAAAPLRSVVDEAALAEVFGTLAVFVDEIWTKSYGNPKELPTTEKAKIKPEYPYALTKLLGEQIMLHWSNVYDLPVTSLRLFNVYGTRSRTSGTYGAVFGVFLAQKLAKKAFTVVGDGSQTRDFTYVSDVVRAIICAVKSSKIGEIYNVGSGQPVSVNRIVKLLGAEKITYIPKRPGEPDKSLASINKIKKELGWEPKIKIKQGVEELLKNINF